ncbi:MAG: ATP-binding protein [Bacteroidia bacterium]|nr:ATP-binding protein [Bacteroidia bacterium]
MEKKRALKIAVIGAESTGKTWLCEELAIHFNTVWVPEYAREYFNHSDIYNYTLADLEIIAKKQMEMENQLFLEATNYLFCDTALITLKIWAELEFKRVPDIIAHSIEQLHYDFYLICNNDVDWVKDEQRQNKFSRELIFEMNIGEARASVAPFYIVAGKGQARLQAAINEIERRFIKS